MPKINLYTAHSLPAASSCEELMQQLTAQLDSVDEYDTVNRGRVETARAVLGDPQRRTTYDSLLADPAAHIDEQVLASIASGASSAPTQPPVAFQPLPGSYPPVPVQQQAYPQAQQVPYPPVPQPHQAPAQPSQQWVVRVVVVPDGLMPKAEYWADDWAIEMSPDGSAIRLVGTGKGSAAKKAAKNSGNDDWAWITGGGIAGMFFI